MKRLVFACLTFILAFLVILALWTGRASMHRHDYGIIPDDLHTCVRTDIISGPKAYPPPGFYDAEEVSNIYLPYAVASLNAYTYRAKDGTLYESDGEYSRFTLGKYSKEWMRQKRIQKNGGLALDYYFNDSKPDIFTVLVAFRGTEFYSVGDWGANLSWFTQLIPIENQYDYAREAVAEIYTTAKVAANGKKLSIITTGHSLGGGLAEHIAYAFPCTSAVVFDSSFVVNYYRLAEPFDDAQVVHIFDKNDELTFVRRLFFSDKESPTYKRYGINPVAKRGLQHRSEPLAVGMAGMVAMCQADPTRTDPPGCPKTDIRARRLYCGSRYAEKEQNEPQCKF